MSQLTLADCWPRRFSPSSLALQFCEDPTQAEQPLFAKASAGAAVAQLWQAPQAGMAPPLRGRSGAPGAGHYQP